MTAVEISGNLLLQKKKIQALLREALALLHIYVFFAFITAIADFSLLWRAPTLSSPGSWSIFQFIMHKHVQKFQVLCFRLYVKAADLKEIDGNLHTYLLLSLSPRYVYFLFVLTLVGLKTQAGQKCIVHYTLQNYR